MVDRTCTSFVLQKAHLFRVPPTGKCILLSNGSADRGAAKLGFLSERSHPRFVCSTPEHRD